MPLIIFWKARILIANNKTIAIRIHLNKKNLVHNNSKFSVTILLEQQDKDGLNLEGNGVYPLG